MSQFQEKHQRIPFIPNLIKWFRHPSNNKESQCEWTKKYNNNDEFNIAIDPEYGKHYVCANRQPFKWKRLVLYTKNIGIEWKCPVQVWLFVFHINSQF